MSMLDSVTTKGFGGSECKTLLKLTISRTKLMRNLREVQIKKMRKDIANLLETGQEATARIRVEHIIKEENMMAAQEIIELFCELISVCILTLEAQSECPLDLKEAISSVCFAAPRCDDLPELLQVQLMFASKFGEEFVAAATDPMPGCGVNRQLIELLSVYVPSAEKRLKLLKKIAEEHGVKWDPAASEAELFKSREDLLDGSIQSVSGSKMPLPEEKHEEVLHSTSMKAADTLEIPEALEAVLRPNAKEEAPIPHTELVHGPVTGNESTTHQPSKDPNAPEHLHYPSFHSLPSKFDADIGLQGLLAAANAAAETAERAAAAARLVATLAQLSISELAKNKYGQPAQPGDTIPEKTSGMDNVRTH